LKRFLVVHVVAVACFLAGAATFNLWVDPYRLWTLQRGYAETKPRPRATQQVALLKKRGIERMRPTTIILGNSRAEIGFNPASALWPPAMKPVYNGSIPGTGIGASLETLATAVESGPVRYAIVGLDFLDFLVDPELVPTAVRSGDYGLGNPIERHPWTTDLKLALSLDTLADSVITLSKWRDPYSADVTLDGFNPLTDYQLHARQEGYGPLFLQRDIENGRKYGRLPRSVEFRHSKSSPEWQTLDRLLALAESRGVTVKFVIYPYHAHILEMFHAAQLVPAFEAWKRRLVATIHRGSSPRDDECSLWDFSGYHEFAKEPVPATGDTSTQVRWYWEAGHFKPDLGDRMLARMLGAANGFGVCLTSTNVDEQNLLLREGHASFVLEMPTRAEALENLIRSPSARP
jgi:hypothetical protein